MNVIEVRFCEFYFGDVILVAVYHTLLLITKVGMSLGPSAWKHFSFIGYKQ